MNADRFRLLLAQVTHSQLPNRGNFHSDPEQWVQDRVSEDSSSVLPHSIRRTIVAAPLEGNPSSQIHSHLPSHLEVPLSNRVAFPVPPQPRPRKAPIPMAVSNDARVLERLEANGAGPPFPSYDAAPTLQVIPESFSPFLSQLPVPGFGPADPTKDPSSAQRHPSAEQIASPGVVHGQNRGVPPSAAISNPREAQIPAQYEQSSISRQPQRPPPRHKNDSTQDANVSHPMLVSGQSQSYRPPQAYPPYPLPQPIYYGPQVQPHQLQNHLIPAILPSTDGQRRTSGKRQAGRPSQGYSGGDRRGSVNPYEFAQTPRRRERDSEFAGNESDIISEKLWVGNLTREDSAEGLVPVFAPLGGCRISPLKESATIRPPFNWYTFVR